MFPGISLAGNSTYPVVTWIGSYSSTGIGKETSGSGNISPMVVARRRGSDWGSFFKSSSNVHSVNSNSTSNSTEQTVITWGEGQEGNYTSRWVRRVVDDYTDPHTLGTNAVQTQVSNGSDLTNIGGILLATNSTPYDLHLATTDFDQPFNDGGGEIGKDNELIDLAYGREGIIGKNGVEFLFDVGDIFVEDTLVRFMPFSDTLYYTSAEDLNNVVKSETFHLTSNIDFRFTDYYYVMNPEAADTVLTENDLVNFKVELVDASTGTVVGTYDDITYTKYQLDEHNNVSYQVDCGNITAGDYYLRLVTTVQGGATYNLANFQHSEETLEKHNYNRVNFDGSKLPTTYDLSQNYPNPFNPTTTINYQVPQNSFVTLKVYDILGREVATLVNDQKTQGRYSVNFDASRLASGVYIYQVRANDFVSSKKMMLVK